MSTAALFFTVIIVYGVLYGIYRTFKALCNWAESQPNFEIWYKDGFGHRHKYWLTGSEPDCIDKAYKFAYSEPDYRVWVENSTTNEIVWKSW